MNWWKERVGSAGFISDMHDGESWKAEVADPVMNQEGEVQMWCSDCGDGADPCTGKHGGPQTVFFSAKRYFNACVSPCIYMCKKVPLKHSVLVTLAKILTCTKSKAHACQTLLACTATSICFVCCIGSSCITRCLAAEHWQRDF